MKKYKKSMFAFPVELTGRKSNWVLLFHTVNRAFVIFDKEIWSALGSGPFPVEGETPLAGLVEQGMIVSIDMDETAIFKLWNQRYVHDFSTIKSKIMVTRMCNLACVYCILEREPSVMTPETALEMDRFYMDLIRKKGPLKVADSYLGGEPLLNYRVIVESAARKYYFCRGKGIGYEFSITTNGTLITVAMIKKLLSVGLSGIRVSLAGPERIHDRLRPSRKNTGTHARIVENLKKISGLVPITVECQYDSASEHYKEIPRMMDELSASGIGINNIAFTPIFPRRKNNRFFSGYGDPKIVRYLHREAAARNMPVFENPPSSGCLADFRSRFVFDTDGSIIPCPSLQEGEMAYGHVSSGVDFVRESQVMNRQLPEDCYQCTLLPLCKGGCRLQALSLKNDFNGIDCNKEAFEMQLEEYVRQKGEAFFSQNTENR